MNKFVVSDAVMTAERKRHVIEAYAETGVSEFEARRLIQKTMTELNNGDSYLLDNGDYTVLVAMSETGFGTDMIHLSMRNAERTPMHWSEKQAVKNAIVGEEFEAIELYPKESRLVDGAMQYHLFCLPIEGTVFPFGIN